MYLIKIINISLSSNSFLEEGGTIFTFEGTGKGCSLKCVIKVHNPQFYWKVCIVTMILTLFV